MPITSAPGLTGLPAVGSGIARNIPAYNILGSIYHLLNGTLSQHGPAPSLLGRLTQAIAPNFGQSTPNPQGPVDPTDPNNPLNNSGSYTAAPPNPAPAPNPAVQTPGQPAVDPNAARNRALALVQQLYSSGRFPGAPAFAPTVAQAEFPGSAIGPIDGGNTNPYDPSAPAGPITHDSGLSPLAAALSSYIQSRNIA